MERAETYPSGLQIGLFVLQLLIGLTAAAGGSALVIDPSGESIGLTPELLYGSPFTDYFVPGTVLIFLHGLGTLGGAYLTLIRSDVAGEVAGILGLILMAWILAQVWTLDVLSWMQPVYLFLGGLEFAAGLVWVQRRVASRR